MEQFAAVVRRELQRADRCQASFSLIRLDLPQGARGPAPEQTLDWVLQRVRAIDEVGWLGARGLGILLPETESSGARKLLGDLRAGDPTGLLRGCGAELASYPGPEVEAPAPSEPTHAVGAA